MTTTAVKLSPSHLLNLVRFGELVRDRGRTQLEDLSYKIVVLKVNSCTIGQQLSECTIQSEPEGNQTTVLVKYIIMYTQKFKTMFKQLNSYFAQESKTSVPNPNLTTHSGTDPVCRGKKMQKTEEEERQGEREVSNRSCLSPHFYSLLKISKTRPLLTSLLTSSIPEQREREREVKV